MLLDAYLKLTEPALEGESTDNLHAKEIGLLSFEQSIFRSEMFSNTDSSDSTSRPRSEHSPLRLLKLLDKTSPKLYEAACKGTLYQKAVISLCQPSGTTDTSSSSWKKLVYFEVTLEHVHVTQIHFMGDPRLHPNAIMAPEVRAMGPIEEIDLSYRKIKWLYKGGTGKLNISGGWNLATNSNA